MTTIPDVSTTSAGHEDNAQAILLDLQRLMQGIRGLTLLTTEGRRRATISGHVDPDFLRGIALLIDAHPNIAATAEITSAEIRDHLNYSGSYHPVGEELMLNGRKMVDTVIAERASVGARALRALQVARTFKTPAERAAVVPHLEAIDRQFSRGRYKRPAAKKPADPATARKKEVTP